jgi:hypothetical protein
LTKKLTIGLFRTVVPFEASVTSRSAESEELLNIELDASQNAAF